MAFYHNNQYLYYLPSFNSEYKKYSPGRLLLEKSIEYAIDRKFKKFDFLNGNESYKYNYSNDIEFLRNRAYPLMKGAAFARSHNQKFYPDRFAIDKRIMKKE